MIADRLLVKERSTHDLSRVCICSIASDHLPIESRLDESLPLERLSPDVLQLLVPCALFDLVPELLLAHVQLVLVLAVIRRLGAQLFGLTLDDVPDVFPEGVSIRMREPDQVRLLCLGLHGQRQRLDVGEMTRVIADTQTVQDERLDLACREIRRFGGKGQQPRLRPRSAVLPDLSAAYSFVQLVPGPRGDEGGVAEVQDFALEQEPVTPEGGLLDLSLFHEVFKTCHAG